MKATRKGAQLDMRAPLEPGEASDLMWFLDLAVARGIGEDYRAIIQRISQGDDITVTMTIDGDQLTLYSQPGIASQGDAVELDPTT